MNAVRTRSPLLKPQAPGTWGSRTCARRRKGSRLRHLSCCRGPKYKCAPYFSQATKVSSRWESGYGTILTSISPESQQHRSTLAQRKCDRRRRRCCSSPFSRLRSPLRTGRRGPCTLCCPLLWPGSTGSVRTTDRSGQGSMDAGFGGGRGSRWLDRCVLRKRRRRLSFDGLIVSNFLFSCFIGEGAVEGGTWKTRPTHLPSGFPHHACT